MSHQWIRSISTTTELMPRLTRMPTILYWALTMAKIAIITMMTRSLKDAWTSGYHIMLLPRN